MTNADYSVVETIHRGPEIVNEIDVEGTGVKITRSSGPVLRQITSVRVSTNGPSFGKTISVVTTPSAAINSAACQWYRVAEDGTETPIPGAVDALYTIGSADLGYRLKVVVSGLKTYYGAASATTTYAAAGIPLKTVELTNYAPIVADTIRATTDPGAASCTYQWYRIDPTTQEMTRIEGATNAWYEATTADVGYKLKVYAWGYGNYRGSKAVETGVVEPRYVASDAATANSVIDDFFANEEDFFEIF